MNGSELIVAIVASITSLAVAIVSLLTALVSNRQSLRSMQLIEKLRKGLERQRSTEALQDTQLNESFEELQLAVRAIQRVKDEVQQGQAHATNR
jgi:hypothetical protein